MQNKNGAMNDEDEIVLFSPQFESKVDIKEPVDKIKHRNNTDILKIASDGRIQDKLPSEQLQSTSFFLKALE